MVFVLRLELGTITRSLHILGDTSGNCWKRCRLFQFLSCFVKLYLHAMLIGISQCSVYITRFRGIFKPVATVNYVSRYTQWSSVRKPASGQSTITCQDIHSEVPFANQPPDSQLRVQIYTVKFRLQTSLRTVNNYVSRYTQWSSVCKPASGQSTIVVLKIYS